MFTLKNFHYGDQYLNEDVPSRHNEIRMPQQRVSTRDEPIGSGWQQPGTGLFRNFFLENQLLIKHLDLLAEGKYLSTLFCVICASNPTLQKTYLILID